MPAFTLRRYCQEKISPQPRGPIPAVEKEPRGVIFGMLDRLVVVRVKRTLRRDKSIISRRERRLPD